MQEVCSHYGKCGGCMAQDTPYELQLTRKGEMLRTLFAPWWQDDISVTPSPVVWNYRNKIDPVFGLKRYDAPPPPGFQRETVLGFKERGRSFWPIDLSECRIAPAGVAGLLASVGTWHRKTGLPAFDTRTGTGFLRALLVRDAKRTGQRMVVLITRPGDLDRELFVEAVRSSYQAGSIYRGVFSGGADVATAEELELLHGNPTIDEELLVPEEASRDIFFDLAMAVAEQGVGEMRRLSFRISPLSFFQTNPLGAERLYGLIRQWVRRVAPETLYDLYGGMGGIAFSCADLVRQIISVESVLAASEDGRYNAGVNGIDNVTFATAEVQNWLRERVQDGGLEPNAAAILDPPRSGMHPKALRRMAELKPANILYVSCNPKILAGELPVLLESYRVVGIQAVDMFPHTPHVEVLMELTAKDTGLMD